MRVLYNDTDLSVVSKRSRAFNLRPYGLGFWVRVCKPPYSNATIVVLSLDFVVTLMPESVVDLVLDS